MKLASIYEKIKQYNIADLNKVGLPFHNSYNFFDLKIKFKSNSPHLLQVLEQLFSYFSKKDTINTIEINFFENGQLNSHLILQSPFCTHFIYKTDNGIISIYKDSQQKEANLAYLGVSPKTKPPLTEINILDNQDDNEQLYSIAEFLITILIASMSKECFFFHAASLSYNGQGIILAGETMSGKSTLSLGLANKGFDFLSDEVVCFELDTHKLRPFPKSICLRENSIDFFKPILSEKQQIYQGSDGKQRWLINPRDLNMGANNQHCRAAHFFILKGFKEEPQVKNAKARDALQYTMSSSYVRIDEPAKTLFSLTPIFNDLKCYFLLPGSLEKTLDLIKEVIEQ